MPSPFSNVPVSSPLRVAIVTETFLPKIDGIVNTLVHLLRHLNRRGHRTLLFAPWSAPSRFDGIRIVRHQGVSFPLYKELQLVPPTVDLTDDLADFDADLVHVVNPVALGIAGLRAAKELDLPVVASYHTDIPGFAERWGLGFCVPALWPFIRWIHGQADLNLCPSEHTRAELLEQGIPNVRVWGRGVDTELFDPAKRAAPTREVLTDGQPDAPLLIYVGRVSLEKRIDWLAAVLDRHPTARLAVVGDGPDRERLELVLRSRTVFTGFLRGGALAEAYASGDIFVFPAANETLGNVVLEAMASGLPVVAARSGGVLDHVRHEENGLFFEPEDKGDLVDAVSRLLNDPDLARTLGRQGRTHAETIRWPEVLDRLVDDYRWAAAPRHREDVRTAA